jgi:serine/threonine protein kinase
LKACVKCGQEFDQSDLDACPDDGTTLVTLRGDDLPAGTVLGDRYEIIARIADGGMGKIYKAKHKLIDKYVAVKTLLPNLTLSGAVLKRFQQEADAISKLNHPNILSVTDFFVSPDGHPYLVVDWLEGKSLQTVLDEDGKLTEVRAMNIFGQTCAALKHAHFHGVVHRDLKPSNVMLVKQDEQEDIVKIIDFGIAKIITEDRPKTMLTETGDVFGSPPYMSPEQCRGKPLDGRSDIYSLGCILFAMLSGRPPFVCNEDVEYMFKHVHETPPTLPDDISANVVAAVQRMLAKEPDDRFQTVAELMEALNTNASGTVVMTAIQAAPAVPTGTNVLTNIIPVKAASKKMVYGGVGVVASLAILVVGAQFLAPKPASNGPSTESAAETQRVLDNLDFSPPPPVTRAPAPVPSAVQPATTPQATPAPRQHAVAGAPRIAAAPRALAFAPSARMPWAQANPNQQYLALLNAGRSAFAAQNYSYAQLMFNKAHDVAFSFGEQDSRFVDSLEWQGKTQMKLGNYAGAIQAFQFVVSVRKTERGNVEQYKFAEEELASARSMLHKFDD